MSQKTSDLETQLLNLAKQKLTNQKQAKALIQQLEVQWKEKQTDWEQEKEHLTNTYAQTLDQTKANHQEEIKALNQKHQTEQTQAVQQTQEQAEQTLKETKDHFETEISVLELNLETQKRELAEKESKITELTQWSEGQHERIVELETAERNLAQEKTTLQREKEEAREAHQTNLQEQKTFFENQLQAEVMKATLPTKEKNLPIIIILLHSVKCIKVRVPTRLPTKKTCQLKSLP